MAHPYRQPHQGPPEPRRFPVPLVGVAAAVTLVVSLLAIQHRYAKPHCAVTDCETGKIVDDGCVNGVCMACTNACGQFN